MKDTIKKIKNNKEQGSNFRKKKNVDLSSSKLKLLSSWFTVKFSIQETLNFGNKKRKKQKLCT